MTPLANIDPIRREPVATQVAKRLIEEILSGQFVPGARMPSERQMAEAFGVPRSTMREALKALSLIGLVEVRQGDGTYLRRTDSALLPEVIEWGLLLGEKRTMDLVEARQEIEIILAGFAAARRTDLDLEALRLAMRRMETSQTMAEFVDADVEFHLRVAEASANLVLRDVHASVQALLRAWIMRVLTSMGESTTSRLEHVPILAAIEANDVEGARQAMQSHMASATARLVSSLDANEQVSGIEIREITS